MRFRSASFGLLEPVFISLAREPATILVASDGTAASDHALEFARSFTLDDDAAVHVVSVCEPTPDPVVWPGLVSVPSIHDQLGMERARRDAVRAQIERVGGDHAYWPSSVTTGVIATSIAKTADDINADLIVTGRGRHPFSERILGEEHLLKLIRESHVPVLAASASLTQPPSRVAVGVDFGKAQTTVAQGAARWIADDATVFLVHARPAAPLDAIDAIEWYRAYDERARTQLDELAHSVDYPGSVRIETRIVDGHPGSALVLFCANEQCDLVVAGAQGTGFVHRLVVGSATTYLLRHARCSLLAIPTDE